MNLAHPWNAISEIVTISLVASGGRFCFLNSHHYWVLLFSRNFHYVMVFSSYILSYGICEHLHTLIIFHLSHSQVTCNIILSFLSLMKLHIIYLGTDYFVRITSCLLFLCTYILALLMLLLVILCAQIHCILPYDM